MSNWSGVKTRLLTAAVLAAVFLLALFLAPPPLWAGFIALFLAVAAWEWAGLLGYSLPARWAYTLATPALAVTAALAGVHVSPAPYLPALVFWVVLVPPWLSRGWSLPGRGLGALIGWVLLLPTFLALIYLRNESAGLLLASAGVAIVADSAAYFSGRAFGRRKLAPTISPGKTWEGAVGAGIAITLYAVLLQLLRPLSCDFPCLLQTVLAFWLLFVLSVVGDLFESWIKRRAGVKDSGALLPGHGGVLDRIDSQLAVLPVAALLWMGLQ